MTEWPHEVCSVTVSEIREAIEDPDWQSFRLSLKGIPTTDKLIRLDRYRKTGFNRVVQVRIDNYINALKRGGQLDTGGRVQR